MSLSPTNTINGTYYSDHYSGPCYCAIGFGEGRISDSNASEIFFPALHDTLIAGKPSTIRWNSSYHSDFGEASFLSLTLYYYYGTCVESQASDYQACEFSSHVQEALVRVPNTGEAEWTPEEGLESRVDYMFQGCLTDAQRSWCSFMSSRLFTIKKHEDDIPLRLPTVEEIQGNLSSRLRLTSTTSLSRTAATSSVVVTEMGTTTGRSTTTTPSPSAGLANKRIIGTGTILIAWLLCQNFML